jgi:hypothetical protein
LSYIFIGLIFQVRGCIAVNGSKKFPLSGNLRQTFITFGLLPEAFARESGETGPEEPDQCLDQAPDQTVQRLLAETG